MPSCYPQSQKHLSFCFFIGVIIILSFDGEFVERNVQGPGNRKIESTMFQTTLDTPVGTLLIEGTRDFITSYPIRPSPTGGEQVLRHTQ